MSISQVDTSIRNGKVVTSSGMLQGGVAINEGKIVKICSDTLLPRANRTIDAKAGLVLPGLIDPHVHVGLHPPTEIKADFKTESECAAHGGVTTMIPFLILTEPYLPRLHEFISMGEQNSLIDFGFHTGTQVDEHLKEMPNLFSQGVTSFKFFYNAYKGEEGTRMGIKAVIPVNSGQLYAGLEIISNIGFPAVGMIHAEDMDIIAMLKHRLQREGRTDLRAWSEVRPNICEATRINNALMIANEVKASVYFVHVSAKESVELIAFYKKKGAKVVAETCPHYLTLTKHMDKEIGILGKVNPPLRDYADVEKLWQGLKTGTIECIGTDHCNHTKEEKLQQGDIWSARGSWPGMEVLLSIMMSEGVHKRGLPLETMVRVCSENNAKVFGMYPRKGIITPGADADLVIVDPNKKATITAASMHGRSRDWSVYEGLEVKGLPVLTMVRGSLIMENGEITDKPGSGSYIPGRANS